MKVLQIARYGSVRGGAETYIAALSHGLREAGHEVVLACALEPDMSRPEVRDGFLMKGVLDGDVSGVLEAIARARPDVVHVHTPDLPWIAAAASARAPTLLAVHDHRLDCPVGTKYWAGWKRRCTVRAAPYCLFYNAVAHCGSMRANATLRPYRGWRAARAAADALPIQVFSRYMRDEIAASGFDVARVSVTPYPTPAPAHPSDPGERDRRPVLFASGRLNKEKGFAQLIAAVEQVRPAVHLVIAGDGHQRDALERLARGAGGGHRVTFPGWLPAERLAGWRAQAAIVAVPSMWPEPFGIVGLEAMAAGKPVVAFDAGGIREWLADGETGVLVPPGDVRAMTEAIGELLADPDRRALMGEAGRLRAERAFSLERHVRDVVDLYAEAAA